MIAANRLLLLIILLTIVLPFVPWWVAIIVCAIDGFSSTCQKCAALRSGLALGIVWFCAILFRYYDGAETLMNRVAEMIGLGSGIYLAVIIILLGIISGSLSGYTGSQLKVQFIQKLD